MDDEFMKRGYLLPEGCKDLIELSKYQQKPVPKPPASPPPLIGEMTVTEPMTVGQLASALKQTPYQIIADLMEIGVYARLDYLIAFDAIAKITRKYGYLAKKTP